MGTREVMGVIIDDSGGENVQDFIAKPTALVAETRPLPGQTIKDRQVAKMAIEPAPRKSGDLGNGNGGRATAGGDPTIGPPDAQITSRKLGLGGIILIGVAVLTFMMILGGKRS